MQNVTLQEVIETQSLQKDWVPPLHALNLALELEKKKTRQEHAVTKIRQQKTQNKLMSIGLERGIQIHWRKRNVCEKVH